MKNRSVLLLVLLALPLILRGQPVVNIIPDKEANYVILDAASWGSDIELAFGQNEEYMCLYSLRGADQELEGVAPYLF